MPTYEYACKDCGEHLEVVQSFKDDALSVCPSCQGELRKVFSAAGIIFKGSGWHIKDYKDGASKPAASTADSASKADSSTASSKEGGSKEGGSKDAGAKASGSKDAGSSSSGEARSA